MFMRVFLLFASISPVLVLSAAWSDVQLVGRTSEAPCAYVRGEKMTFELALRGKDVPAGDWRVRWTRTGDDGRTEEGTGPLPGREPLRVTTALDRPGFVRLQAFVTDAAGKDVAVPGRHDGKISFNGGAGVEPEKLQAPPEPAGLDAWWGALRGALPKVPMNPRLKEYPSGREDVKLYAFTLDCPSDGPCVGWLAVPAKPGKYPLRAKFFGYNESWQPRAMAVRKPEELSAKELRVWISPHGCELAREPAYYAAERKRLGGASGGHAWDPAQNASPDTSYFKQMAWRVFRGLGYAKRRPEWDGRTLVVTGGSQGALQAVWAAAYDPAVTAADISIVWNCDAWGKAKDGRLIGDWALPWAEGLRYFDAASLAKRIPAKCRVDVGYAGLGDYIAPPSGIVALYNAVRGPKHLRFVQGGVHGWAPSGADVQRADWDGPIPPTVRKTDAQGRPNRTHAWKTPAKMEWLRPGEVKPRGWLRDWCVSARKGYVSRLDEVDKAFPRAWNRDFHPRGKYLDWSDPDKGAWCTEGGAYWFEGLVRLAWELDDKELQAYAKSRLEPLLERMNPKSIAFVYWMDRTDPKQMEEVERANHGFIVGASGRTTRALLAYYEATGDERAVRALTWCLDDPRFYFFGNPITLPAAACDTWRYSGDGKLAAAIGNFFATKPYPERWPAMRYGLPVPHGGVHLRARRDRDPNANWEWRLQHGVLCYESMLSWVKGSCWTGDPACLSNVRAWLDFHERHTRQPHGVTVADEQFGWRGPDRGTETCTVAGDVLLYATLAGVTGEGRFADHVERSFFNAGAACVSRDWMNHVYFQAPNRVTGEGRFHAGPAGKGGLYRRKHWPLCCTAALVRILPAYVQAMWMKPAAGGLAATLYAPNTLETELDGVAVAVETKTAYPFDETLELEVKPAKPLKFPLRLRVPEWCAQPRIALNGEAAAARFSDDGFATLDREWRPGDVVSLRFPMAAKAETARDYNDGGKPYCSVSFGPLLFAHGLPELDENTPAPGARADWTVDSSTVVRDVAVVRTAMPARWDWPLDAPLKLRTRAADGALLELVPYGCAKLRVSMFPDVPAAR